MSARRVKGEGSIYQRTEHEAPPHRVNGRGLADQEGIDMTQDNEGRGTILRTVLHEFTGGANGEGTQGWPERHREVYALAIEEVADAILYKPEARAALLAALGAAEVSK